MSGSDLLMMWSLTKQKADGVQDTGVRSVDGAILRQVVLRGRGLSEVTLQSSYFDAHPSYNFAECTDLAGNVFLRIPRCYWWRGNMPDVADGVTPRWTMLLSPIPRDGFTANAGAFKRSGEWLDQYYFGKYRATDAGSNKAGSTSVGTPLHTITFQNLRNYCSNNGADYHMLSLFEWHEILARAVIERNSFQLMPEVTRSTREVCSYRGIVDFCYGPSGDFQRGYWLDGVRTDSSGKYEMWDEAGGSYTSTGKLAANSTSGSKLVYNQGVIAGGLFDYLFLASTMGAESTAFIPDYSGKQATVSCICSAEFEANKNNRGAFNTGFLYNGKTGYVSTTSRLCKW